MASENTYADWINSDSPTAPTGKATPLKCNRRLPQLLLPFTLILLLLKTVFLSVTITKGVWSCCPRDWKLFRSSCYYFSTDSRTWNESEENCSGMAAHLVVIDTREEQDFITNNLQKNASYYMGLLDVDGQNHWQWVDQTPYNQSTAFWHLGEPNGKDELCVVVNFRRDSGAWGWNDVFCHHDQRSICEMKI